MRVDIIIDGGIGLIVRSSSMARSNMNKTNCEEIEEVRNNILTGEKFDEMIKKYEDNPLLDFFRTKDRRPGYCEISLISMWIKTLVEWIETIQDSKNKKKMEDELHSIMMNLVNADEKYQHARLQLKIAATIHRSDNSDMVLLEPYDIKTEHLKDPKRRRKPDLLVDIKGEQVYIEIVTKNEAERYEKYYNIDLLVNEMAKSIDRNKNVYVNIDDPQTIPSVQEINNVLRDVASRFQKGIFSFCIPKEHLFRWDNIPGNDRERFLSYLSNYRDIRWVEGAEIRKSGDDKTIYIFKDENSAEIMVDGAGEKATLKIDGKKSPHLKIKKVGDELNIYHKNNFVITVREGRGHNSCSIGGIRYENGDSQPFGCYQRSVDVIRHIIKNKSAQLPTNLPGFIVADLTGIGSTGPAGEYTKKEMQRCFENHEYCSDILGMVFIANHAYFNTGGCFEEPYFRFFENDNHNCGIDSKDVEDALAGSWHLAFTGLKRYRDLFDDFYNRVHVLKYKISRGRS